MLAAFDGARKATSSLRPRVSLIPSLPGNAARIKSPTHTFRTEGQGHASGLGGSLASLTLGETKGSEQKVATRGERFHYYSHACDYEDCLVFPMITSPFSFSYQNTLYIERHAPLLFFTSFLYFTYS